MGVAVIRYSEQPHLWQSTEALTREVWPEYNLHGDVLNSYWDRLFDEFPDFQFVLYDEQVREVLAEGHTFPCCWDGTAEGLGDGIDTMIAAAFDAPKTNRGRSTLCALAAEIRPRFQGRGLAKRILEVMADFDRDADLAHLIALVRPSWKHRYPITPIDRYVTWTRENGEPFDPCIRIHTRRGGAIVKAVANSMRITGTVAEWEQWTEMRFPDDGHYTFPAGLAPVEINHERDLGCYWEPNVWIVHATDRSGVHDAHLQSGRAQVEPSSTSRSGGPSATGLLRNRPSSGSTTRAARRSGHVGAGSRTTRRWPAAFPARPRSAKLATWTKNWHNASTTASPSRSSGTARPTG